MFGTTYGLRCSMVSFIFRRRCSRRCRRLRCRHRDSVYQQSIYARTSTNNNKFSKLTARDSQGANFCPCWKTHTFTGRSHSIETIVSKEKLNIATTAMRGKLQSKWNEWSTPTVLTMITVAQNHKKRMTKLKHKILSHSANCAVDLSMSHAMKWIYELYNGVCAPRFLDLSIRAAAAQLRLHRCVVQAMKKQPKKHRRREEK